MAALRLSIRESVWRRGYKNIARRLSTEAVVFSDYGNPKDVLRLETFEIPSPQPGQVLLKTLAFPINPADINQVQGVYPTRAPQIREGKFVPGNEGVAKVVGTNETVLISGGTWRTLQVQDAHRLVPAPKVEGDAGAALDVLATLQVNPCTAYRVISDFLPEDSGEKVTIVQNGATSAVGQAVIQVAHKLGLRTVNIVRDTRPDFDQTVEYLKSLGADLVLPESKPFLKDRAAFPASSFRLGLNAVGGASAAAVLRLLSPNATFVTYGGMAKQPVTVGTGSLIFKNVTCKGFWLSRWKADHSLEERLRMYREVAALSLHPPRLQRVKWCDVLSAVPNSGKGLMKQLVRL